MRTAGPTPFARVDSLKRCSRAESFSSAEASGRTSSPSHRLSSLAKRKSILLWTTLLRLNFDRINKIYRIMGKDFDRRNMKDMKMYLRKEKPSLHVIHVSPV